MTSVYGTSSVALPRFRIDESMFKRHCSFFVSCLWLFVFSVLNRLSLNEPLCPHRGRRVWYNNAHYLYKSKDMSITLPIWSLIYSFPRTINYTAMFSSLTQKTSTLIHIHTSSFRQSFRHKNSVHSSLSETFVARKVKKYNRDAKKQMVWQFGKEKLQELWHRTFEWFNFIDITKIHIFSFNFIIGLWAIRPSPLMYI